MSLTPRQIIYLQGLRREECAQCISLIGPVVSVLDFGAGPGHQAAYLAERGFEVSAIDVASTNYVGSIVFPVTFYDGRCLPYPDKKFDAVISSNVLEHIRDLDHILPELRRVLKPGGRMIHAMPTTSWRFWTSLVAFPNVIKRVADYFLRQSIEQHGVPLIQRWLNHTVAFVRIAVAPFLFLRHGERGNAITELFSYRRKAWEAVFRKYGFELESAEDCHIFYTGNMFLAEKLSFDKRRRYSRYLGSGTRFYNLIT